MTKSEIINHTENLINYLVLSESDDDIIKLFENNNDKSNKSQNNDYNGIIKLLNELPKNMIQLNINNKSVDINFVYGKTKYLFLFKHILKNFKFYGFQNKLNSIECYDVEDIMVYKGFVKPYIEITINLWSVKSKFKKLNIYFRNLPYSYDSYHTNEFIKNLKE